MSTDLIAAATALAETLAAENAALVALDLPRATALLGDKQRAAARFLAAQAVPVGAAQSDAVERVARRLESLAAENRALLERAIAVQGRVIGVIARAAQTADARSGYGTLRARGPRPVAFALSANA